MVVRSTDPEPGYAIPALPAGRLTARGVAEHVRARIEGGEPVAARRALAEALRSPEFESAFRTGDVRGWPVGIMPTLDADVLGRAPRALRATLTPRVVTDRVRPGKLRTRHSEVSPETYRLLQEALDRGELLLRAPPRRERLHSLIAHAPHASEDGWWRYGIRINPARERLTLATTFWDRRGSRAGGRDHVVGLDDTVILRAWDPQRWEEG